MELSSHWEDWGSVRGSPVGQKQCHAFWSRKWYRHIRGMRSTNFVDNEGQALWQFGVSHLLIWKRSLNRLDPLRGFNTRSIPSSAASRTFCGKNRSRARARNRNDRVDLGSRLRHDRGRALDGRVLDSIVPVIADGIRSLLQRVQSFQGRVNGQLIVG